MKNMEFILREVDRLFDENRAKEAEGFLLKNLEEAKAEKDDGVCLQILNELIGYYRQTSEKEKLTGVIEEALSLSHSMDLLGSIWYGTTVLNAANGYRSMGELEKSGYYYEEAEKIYEKELSGQDMLLAGLYNNRSLLFQELRDYENAESYLLKALEIVQGNRAGFEIAVTYANLANTAILGDHYEKAKEYALQAISCFEKRNLYDAHYCAALSALGLCRFREGAYQEALDLFEKGMGIVEDTLGRNIQYERLKENRDAVLAAMEKAGIAVAGSEDRAGENADSGSVMGTEKNVFGGGQQYGNADGMTGMELCKAYYEACGRPMLEEKFRDYLPRIAVGLVGEGSDCMGFDDEMSRDHDWGPGFCIFIPEELEPQIGEKLREAYEALPSEFMGYHRTATAQGAGRTGVLTIEGFYRKYAALTADGEADFRKADDASLFAATDGEIFSDSEGRFSRIRYKLKAGYPEKIQYLKLAEDAARISQTGQYNYFRMLKRGDRMTADLMLAQFEGHVMRLWHHLYNTYPPHDKWLKRSCRRLPGGEELIRMLEQIHASFRLEDEQAAETVKVLTEVLCGSIAKELYDRNFISDTDPYLDHQVEELCMKASYADLKKEELVERVVKLEFQAFDQVKNEGGRAYCQNDWPTFSVMRKSQYLTWDRTMLMQYLYDFNREFAIGHNLITEKYGRMMESTAPDKYAELEKHFPEIPEEKKAVIEQIVSLQMNMAEEFARDYPKVAVNARNLHTYEDNLIDTSYETYLRGEISTYSDKMLQLYAGFVIRCVREEINIARETIENTARLYGYPDLDAFRDSIP